jgi:hypothetical protein
MDDEKRYSILPNNGKNSLAALKVGKLSTALLDTPKAARRTQHRWFANGSSRLVPKRNGAKGVEDGPKEQVLEQLQRLLQPVQEIEPTVVVTATTTIAYNADGKK